MTRNRLPDRPDHEHVSLSSWLAVVAVAVAILSLTQPAFNGVHLLAVLLGLATITTRAVEHYRRSNP